MIFIDKAPSQDFKILNLADLHIKRATLMAPTRKSPSRAATGSAGVRATRTHLAYDSATFPRTCKTTTFLR